MIKTKEIIKHTKSLNVLYVEDDDMVRKDTYELLLNYFGHVDTAVDGLDGLNKYNEFFKAKETFYHLIIVDINMPNMNGIDMIKEILKVNSAQDVIVVSAHNESDKLEELMDIGISNYINKPLNFIQLNKALVKAIKSVHSKEETKNEFTKIQTLNHELDSLVDSFDVYVIASRTDLKGKITYASKAYETISGYTEEELLGKPHSIVRHPDMPVEAFKDMWTTIQNENLWVGEVKNLRKNGSFYWVHASIAPYYSKDGIHIGYSAIRLDITAQKKVQELHTQVNNLLNNAGQGFLSFGKNIKINQSFSKECLQIFQKEDIYAEDISNILFVNNPNEKEIFDDGILRIIESDDEMMKDLFLSLLPKEVTLHERDIRIEYRILQHNEFMLILTDITKTKELEFELVKQNKIQKMVVSVASNQNDFLELIAEFESMVENPSHNLTQLLRDLHTYKGIFAQKGMLHIPDSIHELESKLNLEENSEKFNKIFLMHDLKSTLNRDLEIIASILGDEFLENNNSLNIDKSMLNSLELKLKELNIDGENEKLEEILNDVKKLKYESLYKMLNTHPIAIKLMAQKLEKEVYPLEISGDEHLVVSPRLREFTKSLIHLFNNCVEHGIEDIDTRILLEKDEIGTIGCKYFVEDNNLKLAINDDGSGIDVDMLTQNAVENGIDMQEYSNPLHLVFADKLSTKKELSLSSGRGVGMSAIKHELNELNGDVEITNRLKDGVEFTFTIPL